MEPPAKKRRVAERDPGTSSEDADDNVTDDNVTNVQTARADSLPREDGEPRPVLTSLPSPWQLTRVRDQPASLNKDAVSLTDILGDPLITECWNFNFLHDVSFIMAAFDADTRHMVKVHIVHGFWKREDSSRVMLEMEASEHANVELHTAPMPQPFGTHHSKMMILFKADDTAQVIIHTANMISKDWTNLTNAVWRSPPLPRLQSSSPTRNNPPNGSPVVGSGQRLKVDLLAYLAAYNTRKPVTKQLVNQLQDYDFSNVRASLVASVPGYHSRTEAPWGWPALKRTLGTVPCSAERSEVAVQVSSIATLGPKDTWLKQTLFDSLSVSNRSRGAAKPTFKVIFPTPDEIRQSLDGYNSGASIHMKTQSQQQAKQLIYMRPYFCHWANDSPKGEVVEGSVTSGGRERAAPHIKTYIRYGKDGIGGIDWALLTSANLSKQAWGDGESGGKVRISSWEIGVMVWPELWAEHGRIVGVFQTDMPEHDEHATGPRIGLRIPYNLPLQPYGEDEVPWVPSMEYLVPDRFGLKWE